MKCSNAFLNLRVHEKQQAEHDTKAKQWAALKEKFPDVANVLIEFNRAFGKPRFVRVEHNGEVILESGRGVK